MNKAEFIIPPKIIENNIFITKAAQDFKRIYLFYFLNHSQHSVEADLVSVYFYHQMLQQATAVMLEARSRQQGWLGRPETAQLLLIVSDGRGINAEGLGVVRRAVRQAREANVFLVFIILDDPKNQASGAKVALLLLCVYLFKHVLRG